MAGMFKEVTAAKKLGRNDPCPCGSGRKYKQCCQLEGGDATFLAESVQFSPPPTDKGRLKILSSSAMAHLNAGQLPEAVLALRELTQHDPYNPEAHYNLGAAELRLGRLPEAVVSLRRAVELQPKFVKALQHLALASGRFGDKTEALAIYRKLSRLSDNPLERRHNLAEALAVEGKYAEAERELRRVLAVAPEKVGSRDLLAQLLSFRGMFEQAQQHLAQVVDSDPEAFRRLTNIKRMTEADRPLIDRMRARAEEPGLTAISRTSIQFALGKAFDDLGDFAQAMSHYEAGNKLKSTSARLDRAALAARYNGLIARFTSDKLKHAFASRKGASTPGDELPVFVVGMPRSGSTLVEQILSSHPAVAAAGELDFWLNRQRGVYAFEFEGLEWGTLSRAAEDYLAELRAVAPGALRVVDKGLTNFELLWLLRLTFPYARIVHCRRHPVDTCLAIFFQLLGGRYDYAYDRGDLVFYYRQYERLMQHWQAVLPGDRFIEVNYEALIADQEAETRRLIAFCGLDWNDACLAPERNRRIVRTSSLWQVRQPVYRASVARWRNYEPWLGELRELLPAAETTEIGRAKCRSS